jgi:hypothetical protein
VKDERLLHPEFDDLAEPVRSFRHFAGCILLTVACSVVLDNFPAQSYEFDHL